MTHAEFGGRMCETHGSGDHHTDRCPDTYGKKSAAEHQWDILQSVRRTHGLAVRAYPGDGVSMSRKEARANQKADQKVYAAQKADRETRAAQQTDQPQKQSTAVSAQYKVACPTCKAAPRNPCRSKITKRVTDTHQARIGAAYPISHMS